MAKGDLSVHGPLFTRGRRVAASATRIEAGEPLYSTATMDGSGVCSANTWTLAAADFTTLGSQLTFGGVAQKGSLPFGTGTLIAQTHVCNCPVPHAGIMRGKGETAASIDTDAEILAIINDAVLVDYNATGASDGGQLYTIKVAAAADTSAFVIVDGNAAKGTLDVEVYATVYRINQDIT
jgi:hypothetical protein